MEVFHTSFIEQSRLTILELGSVGRFMVMIVAMFVGTRLVGPNLLSLMEFNKAVRRSWFFI